MNIVNFFSMKMYKCVIIDDEPYAIEGLKNYIHSIPNLQLIKCFTNPVEAMMDLATADMVDLILIDIDMPQITGIELSKEIRQKTRKLVFTTAYTQYGYDAFQVDADAYLLKPYTLSKFVATIAKLFANEVESETEIKTIDDFFFVKYKDEHLKIVKIRYGDVVAVESKLNYVMIHTLFKKILTYMSLTEISKILNQFQSFVQFQRSFVINKDHIDLIDGNTIKMINGLQIPVGEYYRKDFAEFLTKKLIKAGRKN